MRNVVKRFVGPHEKELNDTLVKLALYYRFELVVTNAFSGHEKGHVEKKCTGSTKKSHSSNNMNLNPLNTLKSI
ncbi:hypothetical protein M222_2097 [Enterococcus faecalis AZ19]|nr:hypothetical protein M222_2097 [Enterococcus faecalis AZ19]